MVKSDMQKWSLKMNINQEKGVTLVELAIVLVIIGLLVSAILKAQELVNNAQINSTIAELELMTGAVNNFDEKYGVYPGDMANASWRIPGCDADPCNNGNGDGVINVTLGNANTTSDESAYFFNQLRMAEFLSGFSGRDIASFGEAFPNSPAGGGFMIGDTENGGALVGFDDTEMRAGKYLLLMRTIENVNGASGILTPADAERIDRELDDGLTDSGGIISQNAAGACRAAAGDDVYEENAVDQVCVIAYRLPQ